VQQQTQPVNTRFLHMGTDLSPDGVRLSYNNTYLTRNGQPWYPVMGEMHFSRVASEDWENSILQMKAAGVQVIATYVFWNHHEATEGAYDWSGNNNLHQFLSLCKKHAIYVWLRPGPWVHAEARNGGFPDWLLNKQIGLRKNDTAYLRYTKLFYEAIARQCEGYWFKQNGAIIGIQVENELSFKKPEAYAHMKMLKQLAIQAGMDVPYYSAFAQGPDDQTDFLYMMGSYPDSPWSQTAKKLVKPIYFIKPLEADRDIGSDLFGKVDGKVRNTFPKLSAEIGGGMQVTYHRRVVVNDKDIAANVFTKIASGLNGVGYYMFHGGLNPTGATSLQESRATQYPNDVPLINYDFEAPIGAMGIISQSYHELRLQHLFLQDFGSLLAAQMPSFPAVRKMAAVSADTVQCAVRADEQGGFIFLSNYQRHVPQPAVSHFQLQLVTAMGTETIPGKPVTFPANAYAIWPWHLKMNTVELLYATAQPLCVLHNNARQTFVFFADGPAEFVFKAGSVTNLAAKKNARCSATRVLVNGGGQQVAVFEVTDQHYRIIEVMVLSREQALQAFKIKVAGRETLVLSNAATVYRAGNQLHLEDQQGLPATQLLAYPAISVAPAGAAFTVQQQKAAYPFTRYQLTPVKKAAGTIQYIADKTGADSNLANQYRDSILAVYAKGKSYAAKQRGPLYQLHFHHLPQEMLYNIKATLQQQPLVKEWIAAIRYKGDVLALYQDSRLMYDDFNKDGICRWRLNPPAIAGSLLQLQLLPLPAQSEIYVEDNMIKERDQQWQHPRITGIDLTPVYHYVLSIH
jgi:hypothetical protein